jgi:predicted MFS family arabinose efflux permease
MAAAILLLLTRSQPVVAFIAPLFVGFGLGIIGSRFLLFFIKLSRHCQRGTSQSTYMLGWESGLAIGVGLGYAVFHAEPGLVLISALVLVLVSLLLYQFTHSWFLTHKNR